MKSFFYTSVLCLLLFSCDSGPKLADICASDTEICALFTPDSWCKSERKDTIFVAFSLKQSPTDDLKYQMLVAYEKYAECVAFSAKIEHIKLKEKRTARVKNYLKAKALIKTLSNETKHSSHPDLLFYHWSRYLDEGALAEFLAMEGSALLETPNGQFNLATHYAKRDLNKTLSLLFHALELYQPEQQINVEIFQSLSTIFTDKDKYQQAYIWLKVLLLYDPENEYVKEATLINFASAYQLEREFLNRVALSTLDKILDGKFEAPKF